MCAFAGQAMAAPAVLATRPVPDVDPADLTFFVGAISESGRSLKASSLELVVDGSPSDAPMSVQSLSEWSTTASEASATWRPPVSVGLVYLWVTGVPSGALDGIQSFFQRVPSRTTVYPTIYGRMRQGRARLTAADVSRLGDVAYLESYRPNMIDAIRLELPDLAADPAALKLLLLVTDGRDFADPKGDGPGDFSALGHDLRKAGITPLVVAFPAPEADAAQAASNLRDLHEAAGGFLRVLDQASDLENTLESLGQGVADLQRVRFTPPLSWRLFGGSHRLLVRQTGGGGQKLNAEIGLVSAPPSALRWVLIALVVGIVVAAGGAVFVLKGRSGGSGGRAVGRGGRAVRASDDDDNDEDEGDGGDGDESADDEDEEVLQAAHDLIRRGASPRRAVDELSRSFPQAVGALAKIDQEVLQDPRFPYFRTRPGRMRLQEIRDILAKKSADVPALSPGVAAVLAEAVEGQTPAEQAAEMLAARVGADEWTAFAGLDLDRLAEALRGSSRAHPLLGRPRARGVAVSIQDALRSGSGSHGILVGWLVRTGGPGRRGETLRISGDGRCVMGQSPSCAVRITGDGTVAPEHAVFTVEAGAFAVAPLGGSISVEGAQVNDRQVLADGETIGVGAGLFIFKSASAGNLSAGSGSGSTTGGGSGGGARRAAASSVGRSMSQRG
jgi:hypothetical protein